jgi:hypothetical protein
VSGGIGASRKGNGCSDHYPYRHEKRPERGCSCGKIAVRPAMKDAEVLQNPFLAPQAPDVACKPDNGG